jgi:hypothetical protein
LVPIYGFQEKDHFETVHNTQRTKPFQVCKPPCPATAALTALLLCGAVSRPSIFSLLLERLEELNIGNKRTSAVTNKRKVISADEKVKVVGEIESGKKEADMCREFGLVNSIVQTI